MKNQPYKWQGEPVNVRFGNVAVKMNYENPLCWYNFECAKSVTRKSECIPALEITTNSGSKFCISNHHGIGVYKLLRGGWPDCVHFSLPNNFATWPSLKETKFDEVRYSKHESERRKWQKETFPEEFEKLQALKKSISKQKDNE